MKKIVRLTESDLTRIVKKVLLEENQNTISKDQFRKLRTIGRPKIYEDKNFISLNWNDPKLIGNNILTITYREGENYFDVILTDKPSGRFCEKLKNVSLLLKQNGGNGNYTTNKSTCGGQFFFGIEKFNSLQEFLPKLHSMIFNLTESDLTRIVRRVINEEMNFGDKNTWSQIEKNLIGFNSPKVIRSKDLNTGEPFTSLNWGSHKERGHNWGVSITSDKSNLIFTTTDDINAKIFKNVMGCNLDRGSKGWSTNASCKLDYSNPTEVVSVVKNLVSSLE